MTDKTVTIHKGIEISRAVEFDFLAASERISKVVVHTPLQLNHHLSVKYDCKIYLKREDLQIVRSYKLRGAYNMMS